MEVIIKKDKGIKKHLTETDPLKLLDQWLREAKQIPHLEEPWAMVLSTRSKRGVSSRVVLLKQFQNSQLIFYTNYLSEKGQCIQNHPLTAMNFYWPQLGRQIRIEGPVKKISRRKSVLYWDSRSRESQLSQWISRQSQPLSSREELENLKSIAKNTFRKKNIPCPKQWGGYALFIQKIEFWKNRRHRLHDRFLFQKTSKGWKKQRLFP